MVQGVKINWRNQMLLDSLISRFKDNSNEKMESVSIGGIKLSRAHEPVHTLLCGSTSVGKSTAIIEMLETISLRGDRMIVADPNGYYAARFASSNDVILNPFDKRSPGWSPFSEVRRPYDFDKIARSIVPDGSNQDAAWHFYAQVLIADTMRSLLSKGESSIEALSHALTIMSAEELKKLIQGSVSVGLFDKDASKALASTRFILSSYLKPFTYLKNGDFSLRNFLESKRQRIFLTWREDMTASLAPLMACWIDVLNNAILSMPPDPEMGKRRIWLVLDELASLGKISSLEAVLTKGRKHNLCCIAGLQSIAQLDRVYGRETSIILRSCFRNLVAFAIAKADPDTTEAISRALGEREVDRSVETIGRSSQGINTSVSMQRIKERLVLPSELNELPNLTAFLALAGNEPTRKIKLTFKNLPEINPTFVE